MKKIKILWSLPFIGFVLGYMGTYLFMQQETTITPNVIGRSLQESVAVLSKQRLGIRLMREQEDVSMPEGIVLDQIPKADNKIRQNQNVFVTVSKKPSLLSVPDFLGCGVKDIQTRSSRSDIDVFNIGLFGSFPRNTCFAQYPSPGAQLIRKRMVVYVSNGNFPLFIIPNFKGFLVEQVKDFAHSNDISLEIVHLQSVGEDHACGNCHVIDQRPISGSIVSLEQPLQIQLQVSD